MSAIPAHLHFVWIGAKLPWFTQLAMQTALRHVPGARVTLWATHNLGRDPSAIALLRNPRFEVQPLDERTLFEHAPSTLPLDLLATLFRTLTQPAARANIARLLVLARFGGVYLDTDTVTLRDLSPLYELGAFCGLEHVVWPLNRRTGLQSYRVIGGPFREVIRIACVVMPDGVRTFSRFTDMFPTAANNAVLGFTPGHPFLLQTLTRVGELSVAERQRRYRLGTHLLQEMLARAGDELGVTQLSPSHFYPLGPEISRHYFRRRKDASDAATAIVRPDTYVIHWYASVSELLPYDEARVLRERDRTVFANIAARALTSS